MKVISSSNERESKEVIQRVPVINMCGWPRQLQIAPSGNHLIIG